MNWVKGLSRATLLLALMGWLGGCATSPDIGGEASAPSPQTVLQQNFRGAVAAMVADNHESARQKFEALHENHPERTGPLANLGILAFSAGDQERARAYFAQVLALDAAHPVALNHLGVLARQAGEFTQAESYYRDALAAESDYLPALMNLAILLDIYLGRPAEALALYEQYQALAKDPNPRLKDWIFDAKNRI